MTFRRAADLAADPSLMEPPAIIVPPLGVAGRVALMTLGPKAGKSTTIGAMVAAASRSGIRCGLLSLDEALPDTLQRLARFDADLSRVFLDDELDQDTLEEGILGFDLDFLALDHLGKLAERSPDFGPNSQGDPLLWGRLIAPFAALARDHDMAVVLLDQARRADGKYAGSYAKAGTVDVLCELAEKDGGLVGVPKGRIALPGFRVDLDGDGRPVFSDVDQDDTRPASRANIVTQRDRDGVLRTLQSAEPEGLRSSAWQALAHERTGVSRTTFYDIRRALYAAGAISYGSRVYRVSPTGTRYLDGLERAAAA